MTSKLTLWKIMFHILMLQQNSIKTRRNLHMNITIAYKENGMPSNVQSQPGHFKRHKSKIIICVENGELYNKQQHVHNLLLAMTHCNCLQSRPDHLKRHKSKVIIWVENDEPYNKQQHVHNLLLAMTHCNYLQTKMCQPQHNGNVEK